MIRCAMDGRPRLARNINKPRIVGKRGRGLCGFLRIERGHGNVGHASMDSSATQSAGQLIGVAFKNTRRNLPICISSPLARIADSTGRRLT
jgi:hypothetical protein